MLTLKALKNLCFVDTEMTFMCYNKGGGKNAK